MSARQWASLLAVQTVFASVGHASMSPVPAAPEELVSGWARSWERQDFSRYSSFYSESFYSAGFKDKKQWLDYRRPRVLNPTSIVVRIDDVKLLESQPERMVVEFIQYYKSERVQMYSIKKQVWRWEQAVWKIQAETSQDIGPERPLITAEVIRPLSVGEGLSPKRPSSAASAAKPTSEASEAGAATQTAASPAPPALSVSPAASAPPVGIAPPEPPAVSVPQAASAPPVAIAPSAPQPAAKQPPGFNFRLESPDRSPIPRAIDSLKFVPVRIRVEGATAFPEGELERITGPQEGKQSTVEDLRQLAERIEAKYKEAGFFLTRVFVPPQHVRDGQFLIRVIEGFVSEIEVEGASDLVRDRVRERLEPLTLLRPARLDAIERALLLLNDSPHIAVSSLLRPGRRLGASTLVAQVEEQNRAPGSLSISNQIGKDSGDYILRLGQQFLGAGTLGDSIDLQVATTDRPERFANASARYLIPLSGDGSTVAFGVVSSRSKPAGEVSALDLVADSHALTTRLRIPLRRSREFSVYAEFGLSVNGSDIDVPDLFNRRERYKSIDVAVQLADWLTQWGSTSASLGITQIRIDDAATTFFDPDVGTERVAETSMRQQKLTFNGRHTIGITENLSLSLVAQGQYAKRRLLSGEKIGFGGAGIGRGYESGYLSGERGLGLSTEFGYSSPFAMGEWIQGRGQTFVFADSANTKPADSSADPSVPGSLTSAGLGFRFQSTTGLRAELLWAKPIKHDRPRQSISEGIFFTLSYSW